MARTDHAADVVVIGGGIVGLSTAYFLAKRNVKVVLVDKGRLAWEQSSRNWGFVRQQGRDPAELPMAVLSTSIWRNVAGAHGDEIDWRQGGNLALAMDEDDLDRYTEGARAAQAVGIDTRVLTRQEVAAIVPDLRAGYLGGLYTATDGQADPLEGTLTFARLARAAGVDVREYCAVDRIYTDSSRSTVTGIATTDGDIRVGKIVCAAGAHSGWLARMAGLSLPQRTVRSTVVMTNPLPRFTDAAIWVSGLGIRQRRDGGVVLGRAAAGTADHDVTLDTFRHMKLFLPIYMKHRQFFRMHLGTPFVRDLLRHIPGTEGARHPFAHVIDYEPRPNSSTAEGSVRVFREYFPNLGGVTIARVWAGVIEATPDLLPVLGEVEALRGFYFATGFSGHGFGLGPGAGYTVAELVAQGAASIDVRAMRYERFAEGDLSKARKIL
jgi:glycine/D-amino acid oxidase-like deaminating enzyme